MYAVIMAGGSGKRFWPRSRMKKPKQMLDIVSDDSMLKVTFDRLKFVTDPDKIYVISGPSLEKSILEELKELPKENMIVEPSGKNTAPCIGLTAAIIKAKDQDAVIGVFPADHLITDKKQFKDDVDAGVNFAKENDVLITFGIQPIRPATGYGYIQYDNRKSYANDRIYKVKTFAEKPNIQTSKRFLESGDFLWNSGMFIWKASSILHAVKLYLPELHESLEEIIKSIGTSEYESTLKIQWATIHKNSVDYGIMEKAKNVYVIKADFDWSDIGSWDALYELKEKDEHENVISGNVISTGTNGCYIYSDGNLISTIGVKDLIIVQSKNAILIVHRSESEKVKEIVNRLEYEKAEKFL